MVFRRALTLRWPRHDVHFTRVPPWSVPKRWHARWLSDDVSDRLYIDIWRLRIVIVQWRPCRRAA